MVSGGDNPVAEQRVQRQLTAILAADVAGYSRLIGFDEEGTLARLKELRRTLIDPQINEHRGRIVKTMGDGLLVQFASAVDAVRCAVEVQREIAKQHGETDEDRRIKFRIGINLGDVVIDGDDIYGDGVNIAARLEALADAGGICVSSSVHDQVRDKLDVGFADTGEQQLKNIARPIRVYRVGGSARGGLTYPKLPDKPSIAVLPFENLSGDREQEYFADGMVEEIITALSRFRQLFVIARNSSFTYKGRAVDVKQIGRELGVRYVLEGSVRKAGDRVRITGQLIDSSTGGHLWADRFDGGLEDIFDLQDRVTVSVVGAIAPRLERAEIERSKRKPTESLDAYDYFLRGMAAFHQFTKQTHDEALALFSRAIELDPNFASAHGMAARCYMQRKGYGWVTDRAREIAEAERLARRVGELGKDDAVALCSAGLVLATVAGDLDDGAALIDRALALNPNLAWAWLSGGWAKIYLGEPETAIAHAARAMRLSPQDPQIFSMQTATALAHFFAGRPDEALSWAETAVREQSKFLLSTCVAAASAGLVGRPAQAEKAMARLRQLNPALRLSNLRALIPLRRPEDFARWADGLRKAGLPE
jgi:adenylate cyclase